MTCVMWFMQSPGGPSDSYLLVLYTLFTLDILSKSQLCVRFYISWVHRLEENTENTSHILYCILYVLGHWLVSDLITQWEVTVCQLSHTNFHWLLPEFSSADPRMNLLEPFVCVCVCFLCHPVPEFPPLPLSWQEMMHDVGSDVIWATLELSPR